MAEKPDALPHCGAAASAQATLTTCPFCSCGCGLYVHAARGVLAGVAPSEHHPVSQGRLCARGWAAHEAPAWGERLTEPLIRKNGGLEPVGWEEALARAADELAAAAGSAVGVLGSPRATNEESYLLARIGRDALGTGNLDSALRAPYQAQLEGLAAVGGAAAARGTLAELEASEVVLLVEGDLAATHTRVGLSVLRAVKRGARLVTLGATRTQFARLAAEHLPAAPGRERQVLLALLAAALEVRLPAALPGRDAVRASLSGPPPGEVERRVAGWFAAAERASVVLAPSNAASAEARETARVLASFLAVVGHLTRPGSALLVLAGRGNLRGACELGLTPDRLPGAGGPFDDAARGRVRTAWGREPNATVGLDAASMLRKVEALLVFAEDPPAALPSGSAASAALERIGSLVVADAFLTPTVRRAQVALPIATFGETDGTVTNLEGRVQRVRALVAPPGSARPGWRVLADLLGRLGADVRFRSAAEVRAELARCVPSYAGAVQQAGTEPGWGARVELPANGRITLGPLEAAPAASTGPVLAWDGVLDWGSDPLVAYSPTLRRDRVSRRKLWPRGLVELSLKDAQELGVRAGEAVRISSASGEARLPALPRADLAPGVLLVPYASRDSVAEVMGGEATREVRLARG